MEKCPFCKNEIRSVDLNDSSGSLLDCVQCEADYCKIVDYSKSDITCFKTNNYSVLITENSTKISDKEENKILACFNVPLKLSNYSFKFIDNKINKIILIS